MSKHDITVREEASLDRPVDLLSIIMRVAQDPHMDVEKMERLLAMQERILKDQRQAGFFAAMNRLQPDLPQIQKDGTQVDKHGKIRNKYARYEDIDEGIRPLYTREGFAVSFNTESVDAKSYKIILNVLHREGHSEPYSLVLPIDNSEFRTPVQNVSSTISQGKRQLLKMAFNIVEKGEDISQDLSPISDEQLKDLQTLIQDTKANVPQLLKLFYVSELKALSKQQFPTAIELLKAKLRGKDNDHPRH